MHLFVTLTPLSVPLEFAIVSSASGVTPDLQPQQSINYVNRMVTKVPILRCDNLLEVYESTTL